MIAPGVREGFALVAVAAAGFVVPLLTLPDAGATPLLAPDVAYAAADTPCGGEPMPQPDRVITGSFEAAQQGAYVMLPFQVPSGTDAVRVKYCHDQPQLARLPGTSTVNQHTLDMGIYGARSGRGDIWDADEFRGWGGSSRKDVTISAEGSIDPDPPPVATQATTIGYRPGRIEPGKWAVELGVAAVGAELGAEDGEVDWRVEIDLIDDPSFADDPYRPQRYDNRPAARQGGWYAGDFHVHARHSAPGDATMRQTFDYAFNEAPAGAALDFITLSDYVSDRSWGEIGAFQADYPGKLIIRSTEVITYRGHINNHASGRFFDYRTGPVLELSGEGSLRELRPPRPASRILARIRAAGGWNQLNHVETFPSEVPTFGNLCRGCSWEYSDRETDYSTVDAIEVATGPGGLQTGPSPGPNPFTPLAIRFYEQAIDSGGRNANHIAAVGSSDSHNAGTPDDPVTQSPIGQATTVVKARELSEQGIGDGVRAGHTYVKIWGPDGPDLRLEATPAGGGERAIIGDSLAAERAQFSARVFNLDTARSARPGAYTLFVLRDGELMDAVPIPGAGDSFTHRFESRGDPARYRLQVERTASGAASIEALSSPIYLTGPSSACGAALKGTARGELLRGTAASDRIQGRGGADRIFGRRGADCLGGGRGNDRIDPGRGQDRVRAGGGADRVRSADGDRDQVRCGAGRDRVRVDRSDRVRGCERVRLG